MNTKHKDNTLTIQPYEQHPTLGRMVTTDGPFTGSKLTIFKDNMDASLRRFRKTDPEAFAGYAKKYPHMVKDL